MLELGKRVVVPRVKNHQLQLSQLHDPLTELTRGSFGVWEPTAEAFRPMRLQDIELVVVPGLAFDRRGYRLGHGWGYFDRLLARLPSTTSRIGLCFDFQRCDRLPTNPHDQAVQTVLSA